MPILPADDQGIASAAASLRAGRPVALPTETVYGLACDARSDQAVAAVYALKGRPTFNPLIVHVDSLAAAEAIVEFDPLSRRLAERFWPGPLTLVLPRRRDCAVSWLVSAGLDTLAVRVPAHPVALRLLRAAAIPLAAPSANLSGRLSPTRVEHVDLGDDALAVLDGGACAVGVESTVLRVVAGQAWLLRPGGLARQQIEPIAGPLQRAVSDEGHDPRAPRSPGQLLAHYAPQRPVRLEATTVAADEALLAFGPQPLAGAGATLNLSPRGDTTEAAAHLFAYLRALDREPFQGIAVMAIPPEGLGEAIRDRLQRAAVGSAAGEAG